MLRSARAQQCQTNTPAPLARRPVVTVPAGASAMGGCQSSPRMGASRVAGSVYFSFSSCPVRPGSICQASSGWGRRGGGAEELFLGRPRARGWREGSGMGGAWRGRRDRRPAKAACTWRAVASRGRRRRSAGIPERLRARPWPAQGRDPAAGTVLRSSDNGARSTSCGWNPMPTNWKICSLVTR